LNKLHHNVKLKDRWETLSLAKQMSKVGSEVSRAIHWKNKSNEKYCHDAVNRSLELLSYTIQSVKMKSHLRELTRLRETLIDYFYRKNGYSSSDSLMEKYFDYVNYVARNRQGKS